MGPNFTIPALHTSHSDLTLRRLLGGMSIFTMLMTIPQILTIWFGHQAAVFLSYRGALSPLRRPVVLVRDTEAR